MMPSSSLTFFLTRKEFVKMKMMKLKRRWDRDSEKAPKKK